MSLLTPAARVAGATGIFIGLALGIPLGAAITPAHADPIAEDDPAWDCRVNGNQVCGPDNSNHVAPGLYRAGRLASPWPTATLCDHPPTLPDLMLGTANCRTEFIAPALVVLTGGLH